MKTGKTVEVLGLYSSKCCNRESKFDVGDTFSRCPGCFGLTFWELEVPVTVAGELEDTGRPLAA